MDVNYYQRFNKNKKYYYLKNNKYLKNNNLIESFNKIYIPPAYKSVKFFSKSNKIYATGIDSAGRTQYKYLPNQVNKRSNTRNCKLYFINSKIEVIMKDINKNLKNNTDIKKRNIAILLKIMYKCNFRIGNKLYEEKYGSTGLTTIKKEHIKFINDKIHINFVGKKKVENRCIFIDKNLEKILKKLYNTNKNYLFSYNDNGKFKDITVKDVNDYLKIYNITNKDLRTWCANYIFIYYMKKNYVQDKKISTIINESIRNTAKLMHNTFSVCKNSYISNNILEKLKNDERLLKKLDNKTLNIQKYIDLLLKDTRCSK